MSKSIKSELLNFNWLKVGSPHSYCINYPIKNKILQYPYERTKITQKKLIHSRAYQTMSRFKT